MSGPIQFVRNRFVRAVMISTLFSQSGIWIRNFAVLLYVLAANLALRLYGAWSGSRHRCIPAIRNGSFHIGDKRLFFVVSAGSSLSPVRSAATQASRGQPVFAASRNVGRHSFCHQKPVAPAAQSMFYMGGTWGWGDFATEHIPSSQSSYVCPQRL